MGKESSNNKNDKSRSRKPYDVSNSFVRKVASRVSGYFGSFFNASIDNDGDIVIASLPEEGEPSTSLSSAKRTKLIDSNVTTPDVRRSDANHVTFAYRERENAIPETTPSQSQFLSPILSEPVAGPSGLRSDYFVSKKPTSQHDSGPSYSHTPSDGRSKNVKEFRRRYEPFEQGNDDGCDDRSESSESTSGCSSLVPQADRMSQSGFASTRRKSMLLEDKLGYARQLKASRQSMYLNRSIPVHMDTPRPSRTPAFDASAFGSPILNKSNVREAMLQSPFYSGHTRYGGASARRNNSCSSLNRQRIPVKPAQASEELNMSHTARKILTALEEFSTPLSDARRIPAPAPLAGKRRALEPAESRQSKLPALTVPVVADLIKMRRVEQIQESTVAARQLVNTPGPGLPRRTGKIVTKIKDRDKAPVIEPTPPPPELPALPLPIAVLPTFDLEPLHLPPLDCEKTFTFSSPSEIEVTPCDKNSSKLSTFTFCPPVSPSHWKGHATRSSLSNMAPESVVKLKRKPTESPSGSSAITPAAELKTGSVMDILGHPAGKISKEEKPPSDTRTLQVQPISKAAEATGFGDKFKPSAGSWSCDMCMVRNSGSDKKCVACETPNPASLTNSSGPTCPVSNAISTTPAIGACVKETTVKESTSSQVKPNFGDAFKPASDSWACSVCLVNNKSNVSKCVACDSDKPPTKTLITTSNSKLKPTTTPCPTCGIGSCVEGKKCVSCEKSSSSSTTNGPSSGLNELVKKKLGSWECSTCLVVNQESVVKCVACETDKPGCVPSSASSTKQSFGLPAGGEPQFKFGIDQAFGTPNPLPNGPAKPIFGDKTTVVPSTIFQFGIPSTQNVAVPPASSTTTTANEVKDDTATKNSISGGIMFSTSDNTTNIKSNPLVFPLVTAPSLSVPSSTVPSMPLTPHIDAKPASSTTSSFGFNGSVVTKSMELPPLPKPVISEGTNSALALTPFGSVFTTQPSAFPALQPTSEASAAPTQAFATPNNSVNNLPVFTFGLKRAAPEDKPLFGGSAGAFSLTAPPAAPILNTTAEKLPSFGAPSLTSGFGMPSAVASPFGSGFPSSAPTATLAFGAASAPTFGSFSVQSTNPPNSLSESSSKAMPPFGIQTQAPSPFGQISAPGSLLTQTPFQFGAATAPTPFSLTVPSAFNFTGGQTPSFSATPQSTEPRRRIIKARRTQR